MEQKHIGFAVKSLARKIDKVMERRAEAIGAVTLTRMQRWILNYLYTCRETGQDVFQKDVEVKFQTRRSTATELLKGMEKAGLIERVPVAHDGRMKRIVLTERALDYRVRMDEQILLFEQKMADGFAREELDSFFGIMKRLEANADQLLVETI